MAQDWVHEEQKEKLEQAEGNLAYAREELMRQEQRVEDLRRMAKCDHPADQVRNDGGAMELQHETCLKCGYSWTV